MDLIWFPACENFAFGYYNRSGWETGARDCSKWFRLIRNDIPVWIVPRNYVKKRTFANAHFATQCLAIWKICVVAVVGRDHVVNSTPSQWRRIKTTSTQEQKWEYQMSSMWTKQRKKKRTAKEEPHTAESWRCGGDASENYVIINPFHYCSLIHSRTHKLKHTPKISMLHRNRLNSIFRFNIPLYYMFLLFFFCLSVALHTQITRHQSSIWRCWTSYSTWNNRNSIERLLNCYFKFVTQFDLSKYCYGVGKSKWFQYCK